MISDNSDVPEPVGTSKKKHQKPGGSIFDYSVFLESITNIASHKNKGYIPYSQNTASLKKIRQRLEKMEGLYDQLSIFTYKLFESLPHMIISILQTNPDIRNLLCEVNNTEKSETGPASNHIEENEYPCPTRREKDILELLVKGLCAKEIANLLFISETTVITHKKNLKEKFHAKNCIELISKANSFLSKTG